MAKEVIGKCLLVDDLKQIPGYAKFIKDVVTMKRTIYNKVVDNIYHHIEISTRSLV